MSVLSRSWRRLAHGFHRGERVAAPDEAVAVTGTVEAEATWRGLEPLEPRILLSTTTGVTPFAEPDPLGPLQPLSNGPVAEVVGRHVFYNNSAFDGHDAGPGAHNDAAIAPDKQALPPGEQASFVHYTSYSRGLNGIMIDILALAQPGGIDGGDFELLVGNNDDPAAWDPAPEPTHVHVRPGDGVDGSDRVELIWPDNAIENTWLQVTLRANDTTGLAQPEVFYFGNAIGETGYTPDHARVDLGDVIRIRANQTGFGAAAIDNPYDLDRSGQVDLGDVIRARNSQSGFDPLRLIALPSTSPVTLTAGLANDTGFMASMTADPAIEGFVANAAQVADLQLRSEPDGAFTSVPDALEPDGSFHLDRAALEAALGEPLADGAWTFELRALDAHGSVLASASVSFTLDTTPPAEPAFALEPLFALTADQTTHRAVALVGETDPGAQVRVVAGSDERLAHADGNGAFRVPSVVLEHGENELTLEAMDGAGNTATTIGAVTRVAPVADAQVMLEWNHATLEAIRRDATDPPMASRNLAMVAAASYDAINAVDGASGSFYVRVEPATGASAEAAAAAAAHAVLVYLYTDQAHHFDALLAATLDDLEPGEARDRGVAVGEAVAELMIELRRHDGSRDFVSHVPGHAVGQWQPALPGHAPALHPQWPGVTPFALDSGDQFRPAGPPEVGSARYMADFEEVKALGAADSDVRTAEQTAIAQFWRDGMGTYTPAGHWNQIAASIAADEQLTLFEASRLLAQLNVAMADASIAAWDAKFTFNQWRPVTAIRQANSDHIAFGTEQAQWRSLLPSPPFPDYISGHATYSGAAETILTAHFGDDYAFSSAGFTPPGGTAGPAREFASFTDAAEEAAVSRLYGGIHFRTSNDDGLATGRAIGAYVLEAFDDATDTTPPVINITSPSAGGAFNQAFTVSGTVVDGLSEVASLEARLNDGELFDVAFNTDGRFELLIDPDAIDLADGPHTLHLRAADVPGNTSEFRELAFVLVRQPPELTLDAPTPDAVLDASARLTGTITTAGSRITALHYQLNDAPPRPVVFDHATGSFDRALPLGELDPGAHTLTVTAHDSAGHETVVTRTFEIAEPLPLTIERVTPGDGATGVSVKRQPRIEFSQPVDPETIDDQSVYLTASGQTLAVNRVLSEDRATLWLFPIDPLPGSTTVRLHIDGDRITDSRGTPLDTNAATGDANERIVAFTTASTSALPGTEIFHADDTSDFAGTSLVGVVADPGPDFVPGTPDDVRPGDDGVLMTGDDEYLLPLEGVEVWILGREDDKLVTGADGRFEFHAVPPGQVKLVIDGHTATNAPEGIYFPELTFDVHIEPGQVNTVFDGQQPQRQRTGVEGVYLARLHESALVGIDPNEPTHVAAVPEATPNLTPEQRELFSAVLAPGTVVDANGQPLENPRIGLTTVPPDLVTEMLPLGQNLLREGFVFSVQSPGGYRYTSELQVTIPNTLGAPPGTQVRLHSGDHTEGRLEPEGLATVSADGTRIVSNPGHGITQPGWHVAAPPGSELGPGEEHDEDCHELPLGPFSVTLSHGDPLFVTAGPRGTITVSNDGVPGEHGCGEVTVVVPAIFSEFMNSPSGPEVYTFELNAGQSNRFALSALANSEQRREALQDAGLVGEIISGVLEVHLPGEDAPHELPYARLFAADPDGVFFPPVLDEAVDPEDPSDEPEPQELVIRTRGEPATFSFTGDDRVELTESGDDLILTFTPVSADDDERPTGELAMAHVEHGPMGAAVIGARPLIDIDPLAIRVTDGEINYNDEEFDVSGTIEIGLAAGEFEPLATFEGGFFVTEQFITAVGTLTTELGPLGEVTVFSGGFQIERGQAHAADTNDDGSESENDLRVAGLELTLSDIAFADGALELQGRLQLPESLGGVAFSVEDDHRIRVTADGVEVTGGLIEFPDIDFNLLGLLRVQASDLSLEYIAGEPAPEPGAPETPDQFLIRGELVLPEIYNATANFAGEDNFIRIQRSGAGTEVDVVGVLSAEDIVIVPNVWQINAAQLEIDTIADEVRAEANVTIPTNIEIDAGIGFLMGDLNFASLGVTFASPGRPIGTTGAFLQSINGEVDHISEHDPSPIKFGGGVGVTGGPTVSVPLPQFLGGGFSGALVELDVSGSINRQRLTADGDLTLIGGLAAGTASAELNWSRGFFAADATFQAFAGAIAFEGRMRANTNFDVVASGTATASIPDPVPLIGGTELGQAGGALQFSNDGNLSNDYVAAWGDVWWLPGGPHGLRVFFDGNWRTIGSSTIERIADPGDPQGFMIAAASANAAASFAVADDAPFAAFEARWDEPADEPTIELVDPSGQTFTRADIDAEPTMLLVDEVSGATRQVVVVDEPMAGTWTVRVPESELLGEVIFDAIGGVEPVSVQMLEPEVDAETGLVTLHFDAEFADDVNGPATLRLFYDDGRTGFAGLPITEIELTESGPGSFVWDPADDDVATGSYFVYAVIEDAVSAPQFSNYTATPINIEHAEALPAVEGVTASWVGDDRIALSWAQVDGAIDYEVLFTADAATAGYDAAHSVGGAVTETVIDGLTPGETYRFELRAVDEAMRFGAADAGSMAIGVVGPEPVDTSDAIDVFADPGTTYVVTFDLDVADAATLVEAPAAAMFDADTGELTWDVDESDHGFFDVVIHVTDATTSAVTVLHHILYADAQRTGTIQGHKFDDITRDGVRRDGEPGIDGIEIELRDAVTGEVLRTATTASVDDEAGFYAFDALTPGTYLVRDATSEGGTAHITLDGGDVLALDFGHPSDAGVHGQVLHDTNFDGSGDTPLPGIDVTLHRTGDDPQTLTTDADGAYSFTGLLAGEIEVHVAVPDGFIQIVPASSAPHALELDPDEQIDERDFVLRLAPDGTSARVAVLDGDTRATVSGLTDFAAANVGGAPVTRSLELTNLGGRNLHINAVTIEDDTESFSVAGLEAGDVLPPAGLIPGDTGVPFTLSFDPQRSGTIDATLRLHTNAPGSPHALRLTGRGERVDAEIDLDVELNNLGGHVVGDAPIVRHDFARVTNTGGETLTILGIESGAGPFTVVADSLPATFPDEPIALAPGESIKFDVSFSAEGPGLHRGEIVVSSDDVQAPEVSLPVTATGLASADAQAQVANNYVAVRLPTVGGERGSVLRGRTDDAGQYEFFLPGGTPYHVTLFDPETHLVAHHSGVTAGNGQASAVPPLRYRASTAPDTDGDGLPDDAEFAIGTNPRDRDTNRDGIDDLRAIEMGLNPLGDRALPTGVLASVDLRGPALDVAIQGGLNAGADDTAQLAYVATGAHGLAIIDASRFDKPRLTAELELPGVATSVSVDPALERAVVASAAGAHIIDVSDPAAPVLERTLNVEARAVEASEAIVYVGVDNAIHSYDMLTGGFIAIENLGGEPIAAFAREGQSLYVLETGGMLRVVALEGAFMTGRGAIQTVATGGDQLAVGDGLVYVPRGASANPVLGGFAIYDARDPDGLIELSGADDNTIGGEAIALNGSGLGVIVDDRISVGPGTIGTDFEAVVDVVDVTDPQRTDVFVTRFLVPSALSVNVAQGLALVGGSDALHIVNYVPFDAHGQPPTIELDPAPLDIDTDTPGIQVREGSTVALEATIRDDVQVRSVELLVDGQVVRNNVTFPFNLSTTLPLLAELPAGRDSVELRVRATDTGGNTTITGPVVLELIADTVAPVVTRTSPGEGDQRGPELRVGIVSFSKAMDLDTLVTDHFHLAGPDGVIIEPEQLQTRLLNSQVQLTFPDELLAEGTWELVIDAPALTDRVGNALGDEPITRAFMVGEARTVAWTNPAGGFWDDEDNWDTLALPGPNDTVVIEGLADGAQVVHREGDTEVASLRIEGDFLLEGWSLTAETIDFDGTFTIETADLHYATVTGAAGSTFVVRPHPLAVISQLDAVTLDTDVRIENNAIARVHNGLTLHGEARMEADAADTRLQFDGSQTLDGTGTIAFAGDLNNQVGPRAADDVLTIGEGITIRTDTGSGRVGPTHMFVGGGVINRGTLIAQAPNATLRLEASDAFINEGAIAVHPGAELVAVNLSDAAGLTVDQGALTLEGDWANTGTITANEATLRLGGMFTTAGMGAIDRTGGTVSFTGTLDNRDATLELDHAGAWQLDGGRIEGGEVLLQNGAELIVTAPSELEAVTLHGGVRVENNLTVFDGLTLHDEMAVDNAEVVFDGSQTLTGTGTVTFHGDGPFARGVLRTRDGATLTIDDGIIVRTGTGDGEIGAFAGTGTGSVINRGTMLSDNDGLTLYLMPGSSEGDIFRNEGLIEVNDGGGLALAQAPGFATVSLDAAIAPMSNDQPSWINEGVINASDATIELGGRFTTDGLGTFNRTGGTITLTGTLDNRERTLTLDASIGSWHMFRGRIEGGAVDLADGAELVALAGFNVVNHLDNVTLLNGMRVATRAEVHVHNGLTLHGELRLVNNDTFGNSMLAFAGSQTLTGDGVIIFDGTHESGHVVRPLDEGDTLTIDSGVTIRTGQAGGSVGASLTNAIDIVNRGTIRSETEDRRIRILNGAGGETINKGAIVVTENATLELGHTAGVGLWRNTGTIDATDAELILGGTFNSDELGTFNRTGGTVALAGTMNNEGRTFTFDAVTGTWRLDGGRIEGGELRFADGHELFASGSTSDLDGVTLRDGLRVESQTGVQVHNGLTLHGELRLEQTLGLGNASLVFVGSQTLAGDGTVTFAGTHHSNHLIRSFANGDVLTIGQDITIRTGPGGGTIGATTIGRSVVNRGTILAETENVTLNLVGGNEATFTNEGQITVGENAGLVLNGPWENQGVLDATNAEVTFSGQFTTAGIGTFNRTGGTVTITGTLDNRGETITLDDSTGSWILGNATIEGGQIGLADGAQLVTAPGPGTTHLDDVTLLDGMRIEDRRTVRIHNGLTLHGEIRMVRTGTVGFTTLEFDGTQTFTGTGTVIFEGDSATHRIQPRSGGDVLTIDENLNIRTGPGGGTVGSTAVNRGVVSHATLISDTENVTLTLAGSADHPFINEGQVTVGEDARLVLAGTWENRGVIDADQAEVVLAGRFSFDDLGEFNRTDGTVTITGTLENHDQTLTLDSTTGSWRLADGRIEGGELRFTDGHELVVAPGPGIAEFDGVTLLDGLRVEDRRTVRIYNGLTLHGELRLQHTSDFGFTTLEFEGSQTLAGTGTVIFDGGHAARHRVMPRLSGDVLTIDDDITIRTGPGGGTLGSTATGRGVINRGTIIADTEGVTLAIASSTGEPFVNQGHISATDGGIIELTNLAPNVGTITVGAASRMDVDADLENTAAGEIHIHLAGPASDDRGRIEIDNAAILAGTLHLHWIDDFEPDESDSFQLITFTLRQGEFDTLANTGLDASIDVELVYNDTDVQVTRPAQGQGLGQSQGSGVESLEPSSSASPGHEFDDAVSAAGSSASPRGGSPATQPHVRNDQLGDAHFGSLNAPAAFDAMAALDGSSVVRPLARDALAHQPLRFRIDPVASIFNAAPFGLAMDQSRAHQRFAAPLDAEEFHEHEHDHWRVWIAGHRATVRIL